MEAIKTLLVITIATARMIFPGVPDTNTDGTPKPAFNTAAKSVTLDLYSTARATDQSRAEMALPEGLGVGGAAKLHIDPTYYALPSSNTPDTTAPTGEDSQVKVYTYWGCGDNVQPGQPRSADSNVSAAPGVSAEPLVKTPETPVGSFAYWPGRGDQPVKKNASAPGVYSLTTDYCGNTAVTLDKDQDFLMPIELVSPKRDIKSGEPTRIEWKPVPNAVGYVLNAYGGNKNATITWTSSKRPDDVASLEISPLTENDVKKLIEKGVMLPPATTNCTIPAGIFKGANSAVLTITAFGKDKVQEKDGITTHVLVRSTATVPLLSAPPVFD